MIRSVIRENKVWQMFTIVLLHWAKDMIDIYRETVVSTLPCKCGDVCNSLLYLPKRNNPAVYEQNDLIAYNAQDNFTFVNVCLRWNHCVPKFLNDSGHERPLYVLGSIYLIVCSLIPLMAILMYVKHSRLLEGNPEWSNFPPQLASVIQ